MFVALLFLFLIAIGIQVLPAERHTDLATLPEFFGIIEESGKQINTVRRHRAYKNEENFGQEQSPFVKYLK